MQSGGGAARFLSAGSATTARPALTAPGSLQQQLLLFLEFLVREQPTLSPFVELDQFREEIRLVGRLGRQVDRRPGVS